jgi:tetratricopeptide (TPR) repeat protein
VNIAGLWRELGEPARAHEAVVAALEAARETEFRRPETYALMAQGYLADDAGDAEGALRLYEEALAIRREIRHRESASQSLLAIGDLHRRAGRFEDAREALDEAAGLAQEVRMGRELALARAHLACLPGATDETVRAAAAPIDDEDDSAYRRLLLYRATGDSGQLVVAKRLLDELLAKNPPEFHEGMCRNVRVNREIMDAWREKFGEDVDHENDDPPSESVTRAGLS